MHCPLEGLLFEQKNVYYSSFTSLYGACKPCMCDERLTIREEMASSVELISMRAIL